MSENRSSYSIKLGIEKGFKNNLKKYLTHQRSKLPRKFGIASIHIQ